MNELKTDLLVFVLGKAYWLAAQQQHEQCDLVAVSARYCEWIISF